MPEKLSTHHAKLHPKITECAHPFSFSADSDYTLYVDGNQSLSTGEGTSHDPFKTIQAAVDAVATAADNSDTVGYDIKVAPGLYTETLTLESDELFNLAFEAIGGPNSVVMDPTTGDALESEADNTNLHYLYFNGFRFKGGIDFEGELDLNKFLYNSCVFEDCTFDEAGEGLDIDVLYANRFWWKNGAIHVMAGIVLENVFSFGITGSSYRGLFPITGAPGTTVLTANTGHDTPYSMADANGGGDQTTLWHKDVFCQRREPSFTATAGIPRFYVVNSYSGLGMGLTIPSGCNLYTYNATIPGAVTLSSGSSNFWTNSVAIGSLSDSGTTTFNGDDTS
ncbi:MAG: hypothetical protein P9X24_04595 [Candidatus Hatepunaea meridiana]|nr:hypothetical protein [Candidatus Hatepunaea meridiana]